MVYYVVAMQLRDQLLQQIVLKSVMRGNFTLASGKKTKVYIDLRKITLDSIAAPLVGEFMLRLTEDLDYEAVGGLTLGADPVAAAMLHTATKEGRKLDTFVVRKTKKVHGLQRRIEGPEVKGRRVLVVEDTSTTGGSVITAVEALKDAGAKIVGVAVIVDRGAKEKVEGEGLKYLSAYSLADLGL